MYIASIEGRELSDMDCIQRMTQVIPKLHEEWREFENRGIDVKNLIIKEVLKNYPALTTE